MESEDPSKTFSISFPTMRSCGERKDFAWAWAWLRDIGDPSSLPPPLDAWLFRPSGRVVAGRCLQRPDQVVGAALCGELLEPGDWPIEGFGAAGVRRNDLHDPGAVGGPRPLVRPQQRPGQPLPRAPGG